MAAGSNEDVVRAMLAAWSRLDPDEIASFFTDDIVYENIPMEAVRGQAELRALLAGLIATTGAHAYEIRHVATAGDLVFTERVDCYSIAGHPIALPVVGVFRLRDGKISEWRDYFDREMAGAALLAQARADANL